MNQAKKSFIITVALGVVMFGIAECFIYLAPIGDRFGRDIIVALFAVYLYFQAKNNETKLLCNRS